MMNGIGICPRSEGEDVVATGVTVDGRALRVMRKDAAEFFEWEYIRLLALTATKELRDGIRRPIGQVD